LEARSVGQRAIVNNYSQFFAGTYFYVLKVQNRGAMSKSFFFALSTIVLMAASEVLPLFGASLFFFHGTFLSSRLAVLTIGTVFWAFNYFLFVYRGRYIEVIKRFERQKQRLLRTAAAIHAIAMGSFFVSAFALLFRMS
jgi:hypothetical protein